MNVEENKNGYTDYWDVRMPERGKLSETARENWRKDLEMIEVFGEELRVRV